VARTLLGLGCLHGAISQAVMMPPTVHEQLGPARRGWEGGIRLAGRFPVRTLRWGRSVVRPGSGWGVNEGTPLMSCGVYGAVRLPGCCTGRRIPGVKQHATGKERRARLCRHGHGHPHWLVSE
jgi:hypothetical protein